MSRRENIKNALEPFGAKPTAQPEAGKRKYVVKHEMVNQYIEHIHDKSIEIDELKAQLTEEQEHSAMLAGVLEKVKTAIDDLQSESTGVSGLHRNGEIALWETLMAGGMFEEWLGCVGEAAKALKANKERREG